MMVEMMVVRMAVQLEDMKVVSLDEKKVEKTV